METLQRPLANIWNVHPVQYVSPETRAQTYGEGLSRRAPYPAGSQRSVSSSSPWFAERWTAGIAGTMGNMGTHSSLFESSQDSGSFAIYSAGTSSSSSSELTGEEPQTRSGSPQDSESSMGFTQYMGHLGRHIGLMSDIESEDPETLCYLYKKVNSTLESLRTQEQQLLLQKKRISLAMSSKSMPSKWGFGPSNPASSINFATAASESQVSQNAFFPALHFERSLPTAIPMATNNSGRPSGADGNDRPVFPEEPDLSRECLISRLVEGKREDYRRIFLPGRGWVSKVKLQSELQISDAELETLMSDQP